MADHKVDVAIIGAGLAGASLAAVLCRRGVEVALFDPHAVAPPDFRAEKLSPGQMTALRGLGLAQSVEKRTTLIDRLSIARFGEIVEERPNREYGLDYADLVNAVRSACPTDCRITGRVAAVEASANRQMLRLGDGRQFDARLVVVATGLGRTLLTGLGIRHVAVSDDHCLAVGFDVIARGAPKALTCFGSSVGDRAAYLTLFPIGDRLRANLFIYRRHNEDWARVFRAAPRETLFDLMPELGALLPDFAVSGSSVLRPIHLYRSEGHVRDGVVLIGDAFATTCPTGGTGLDKVLTDVERLAALVPGWLATPGMPAAKVRAFYDDPVKRACDHHATRMTAHARGMALNPGLAWAFRRYRNFYVQKLRHLARRRWATRLSVLPPVAPSATQDIMP